MSLVLCLVVATLALPGCGDDFSPYNQVDKPRLLAIAAEHPELDAGGSSAFRALVTEAATYRWSWCPISEGADSLYACAITRDQLQALAPGAVVPAFDLGVGEVASFDYDFDPALVAATCAALAEVPLPPGAELDVCSDGRMETIIRLEVSAKGETIVGVRALDLRYQDIAEPLNNNPSLAGVAARRDGATVELTEAAPVSLVGDAVYQLELLGIESTSAEAYTTTDTDDGEPVTATEVLTATWFIDAGDTDKTRSSFIDGELDLDNLRANEWTIPEMAGSARLFVVLRDNRGGVDFISRSIEVTP